MSAPSKAARELAHKLFADNQAIKREWAMKEIQSALADLLEKARAVNDPDLKRFMALQEALEPWKAGE